MSKFSDVKVVWCKNLSGVKVRNELTSVSAWPLHARITQHKPCFGSSAYKVKQ